MFLILNNVNHKNVCTIYADLCAQCSNKLLLAQKGQGQKFLTEHILVVVQSVLKLVTTHTLLKLVKHFIVRLQLMPQIIDMIFKSSGYKSKELFIIIDYALLLITNTDY